MPYCPAISQPHLASLSCPLLSSSPTTLLVLQTQQVLSSLHTLHLLLLVPLATVTPFCCSVNKSCPILCHPMDCSTPGLLVHHQLPKFTLQPGYPTISSSVILFSSHLQSFPASGSFQMSQFFTSGGQISGASASVSVLPVNIQD